MDDRVFMKMAIEQARLARAEDDREHPRVGVVIVKDGQVLAAAHRGENAPGQHAEFTALEGKLENVSLTGATIYTTLEPCTTRNHPKVPCANRLIERKVARVVIGMLDPNPQICGQGQWRLRDANIATDFFPHELMSEIEELNREFIRVQKTRRTGAVALLAPILAEAPAGTIEVNPASDAEAARLSPPTPDAEKLIDAMFDAVFVGDSAAADNAWKAVKESNLPVDQIQRLEALYLSQRVKRFYDGKAKSSLLALLGKADVGDLVAAELADLCLQANDVPQAVELYMRAARESASKYWSARWRLFAARALLRIGDADAARELVRELLGDMTDPEERSEALLTLAAANEGDASARIRAALLHRAALLVPHRKDLQFNGAYALAHAGLQAVAALTYGSLRERDPEDAVAKNNLAVAWDNLDMPKAAVRMFHEAADGGNPLAMANLAQRYLKAGFVKECEELLARARGVKESLPEYVGQAIVALAQAKNAEAETVLRVQEFGTREQRFLVAFADAYARKVPNPLHALWGQVWISESGCEVPLTMTGAGVGAKWEDRGRRQQLSGVVHGAVAVVDISEGPGTMSYFSSSRPGLAYVDENAGALWLMTHAGTTPTFERWARKDALRVLESGSNTPST
jgi:pyrimidine deaminase RibD-like protein